MKNSVTSPKLSEDFSGFNKKHFRLFRILKTNLCIVFVISIVVQLFTIVGCTQKVDLALEEAAIYKVDSMLVAAINERDVETWLSFLSNDAKMMPPNAPAVEGKDAIRQMLGEFLKFPKLQISHDPYSVIVSEDADMAYIWYAYEIVLGDGENAPHVEKGKDISIYRKHADGSWKLVVDIWSSNTLH
ncbi:MULTISPECIES: YybH family protein [unclassified Saccharicrinis]|uniref:YybH family protein n=1 Tax=unclassified Saccharicrinis TaxID=2646859 RepID=UPI003D33656B